jgi:hypothetical protein
MSAHRRPVIVWLPCDRLGCSEAFMLTTKKSSQRYCSHECGTAAKQGYDKSLFQSPLYRRWGDMKTRCSNPNFKQYADYGGRGIKVCERWRHFANFAEDMGPTFQPQLSLDRIDDDGDYCPENCRWADAYTQANNTRRNRRIEYRGEALTVNEWARRVGMKRSTLWLRYHTLAWPIDKCLETPVKEYVR